jgi:predicted phage tail protein|tara:strand:- start:462 stop:1001 length:540 start_codon:yes stop_codon:yes gene_type:complete
MMKKIKLYGPLRKLCGVKEFEADVSNVDQIYSFLKVNYPQCQKHLLEAFYNIQMNNSDITFKNMVLKGEGEIKLIPMISGNFFEAFFITLIGGWFNTALTSLQAFYAALTMGALSFVADLLAPVPPQQTVDPQVESFISNQTANTTKAGGPSPLVFGECLVGSIVISAGADTVTVADNS